MQPPALWLGLSVGSLGLSVVPLGSGDVASSVEVPPLVGVVFSVGSYVCEGGSDSEACGGWVVRWLGRVGPSSVDLVGGSVVSSVESSSVAGVLWVVGSYALEGGSDSVCRGGEVVWWLGRVGLSSGALVGGGVVSSVESSSVVGVVSVVGSYAREEAPDGELVASSVEPSPLVGAGFVVVSKAREGGSDSVRCGVLVGLWVGRRDLSMHSQLRGSSRTPSRHLVVQTRTGLAVPQSVGLAPPLLTLLGGIAGESGNPVNQVANN